MMTLILNNFNWIMHQAAELQPLYWYFGTIMTNKKFKIGPTHKQYKMTWLIELFHTCLIKNPTGGIRINKC